MITSLSEARENGLADVYSEVIATQERISAAIAASTPVSADRETVLTTALSLTMQAEAMRLVAERMITGSAEDDKAAAEAREEAKREVERIAAEEEKRAAKAAAKAAKAAR